jgi:uroporphyrinogen-III synthase
MRILVTRPEPDGARTAAALRARGHDVMLAPVLRIELVPDVDLGSGPWAAILITSANGARAAAGHARREELLKLPVMAVGRNSAEAARAAGFTDVTSAEGDGRDLVRQIAARFVGRPTPLLYLAGEDRARDLTGELGGFGIAVRSAVVYRAAKLTALPSDAQSALSAGRIDAVVHFSRRSVEAYLDAAHALLRHALAPTHYCLAGRAAEPLRAAGATQTRVAARPDEAALLELIGTA